MKAIIIGSGIAGLTAGDYLAREGYQVIAPVLGQVNPPHKTPIEGLWYIGAYSESGGGVMGVAVGARNVIKMILEKS